MYVSTKELPHCLLVMGKMPLAEVSFVTQESLVVRDDVCTPLPPLLLPSTLEKSNPHTNKSVCAICHFWVSDVC